MAPPFVVRYEPGGNKLLDEFSTCRVVFQKVGLLQMFENFQGHNVVVTMAFVETFNGRTTKIGDINITLIEELLATITGLE
jgi:hypothetical protein